LQASRIPNPVSFRKLARQLHLSRCLRVALVSYYKQDIENQAYFSSARADPVHTEWTFCPSTPAAILFTMLFALTTCTHLAQAIFYKKIYCWVIVCSGFIQTLNFIFRIVSIQNPNSLGPYTAWFVLILASHYHVAQEVKR
jgi:hypothetical protein